MSYTPNENTNNISRGRVSGSVLFRANGEKTTAGAASGVLWPNGTFAFPPAAGVQMQVVSTSANDTAAGTGARTVFISYLDANLAQLTETITMNGLVPVNTVATNIRFIQFVIVLTFGALKAAAGDISISNGGQNYSFIPTGKNTCPSSVRMVPAGKRLMVDSVIAGASSGAGQAKVIVRAAIPKSSLFDFTASAVFIPVAPMCLQDSNDNMPFDPPIALTEGQSFGLTYETDKTATITGAWQGWIENV